MDSAIVQHKCTDSHSEIDLGQPELLLFYSSICSIQNPLTSISIDEQIRFSVTEEFDRVLQQ